MMWFKPSTATALLVGVWGVALSTSVAAAPWLNANHQPNAVAVQAVERLAQAANDGLNPANYNAQRLLSEVKAAQAKPLSADAANTLEGELSEQVRRYLQHLHQGRVDPKATLSESYDGKSKQAATEFDAEQTLQQALDLGNMSTAWQAATPSAPGYQAIHKALLAERALVNHPAWAKPLAANSSKGAGLAQLVQRLQAMGDMPSGAAPKSYNKAVQDGVRSFQQRMGLAATGSINKATLDALNASPLQRADRMALTLERMRWTPLDQDKRMLVVNIPEYRLRGYDMVDGKPDVKLTMRVVVGKALDTRTPLFDEDMRHIEINPYWNVPISIARKELVPRLKRDPGYMQRAGFEIVGTGGLDGVLKGTARIRQKPGEQNALGDMKFVMPNNAAIYLHHTTSVGLFNRDRRDFSHGCVRVEEPVKLAQFVLNDPAWTGERIEKLVDSGKQSIVKLKTTVPVVLTYMTAIVNDKGQPQFFTDIYGHDKKLLEALAKVGTKDAPAPAVAKPAAKQQPAEQATAAAETAAPATAAVPEDIN